LQRRAFFEQTAKVEKPEVAAAMRAIVANPNDTMAAAFLSRDPTLTRQPPSPRIQPQTTHE
jgi:hypothetical protein